MAAFRFQDLNATGRDEEVERRLEGWEATGGSGEPFGGRDGQAPHASAENEAGQLGEKRLR